VGQEILDSKLNIETVITAGTSGTTAPVWGNSAGTIRTDGVGTRWLNQGRLTAATLVGWKANHTYASISARIPDTNRNMEVIKTPGISGTTQPVWNTTVGGTTTDNTAVWYNAGAIATFALPVTGGTSGIIIDNVVGSGIQPGASQVYFSTLADQLCATSGGTGGCAVQASQPALQ
jgi:hypothetical protein